MAFSFNTEALLSDIGNLVSVVCVVVWSTRARVCLSFALCAHHRESVLPAPGAGDLCRRDGRLRKVSISLSLF